jgi:thiamine biosynthesis lipoprotein
VPKHHPEDRKVKSSTFRAMNTDISVLAPDDAPHFEATVETARETFETVEDCLSRFRPESELCALNRSGGTPFAASPLLFRVVKLALDAARATGGAFDPTILPALESAGYDRSFEHLNVRRSSGGVALLEAPSRIDYRSVRLDPERSTITLRPGSRIDLGGIGKGFAVDLAIERTADTPHRCINGGGDIAVRGTPGSGSGWTIALEDGGERAGETVSIVDSALATSTISKRRWISDGKEQHHLIDPRTRQPTGGPFRTVSVVARTCVQADVAAKATLVLGDEGIALLAELGLHGIAIHHDESVSTTRDWPRS